MLRLFPFLIIQLYVVLYAISDSLCFYLNEDGKTDRNLGNLPGAQSQCIHQTGNIAILQLVAPYYSTPLNLINTSSVNSALCSIRSWQFWQAATHCFGSASSALSPLYHALLCR